MKKKIVLIICLCTLSVILASCGCKHQWQGSTCTQAGICALCGETNGEPLGHAWSEATCTEAKACSVCGTTEGEALGHNWSEATCTTPKTCSACNLTEGDALGHTWTEATCAAPKTCNTCQQTEGDALEHKVAKWNTTENATCTKVGTEVGVCKVCQNEVAREIPQLEHKPGDWEITKEATAYASGTRVKKCKLCDAELENEEYELSKEDIEKAYKAKCKSYSYSKIARNPDEYKGKFAKFTGEVVQVMQEKYLGMMVYVLRVNVTKRGTYYKYYEDTVYVTYVADEDAPRILEDDIITMYGELNGEKTYETVLGSSVTIPQFTAEYIDIK